MSDNKTYSDADKFNDLIDLIGQLDKKVSALAKPVSEQDLYNSPEINEIAGALAKAQGEFKPVLCNKENPYFKSSYADIDTVVRSVRQPLAKNNLSFIQQIRSSSDGITMLHTKLMHTSGQWIEARSRIVPPKNDPQSFGSTISYQKRYAFMSLLGIAVTDDPTDDDAERAMVASRDIMAKGTAINTKYNPKELSPDTITKEQLEELIYELGDYPDIAEQVLDGLKLQSICDMPKTKYQVSINRIRQIKNMRDGIK